MKQYLLLLVIGIFLFGCAGPAPEPEPSGCTEPEPETVCENSTHLKEWKCVDGEWVPEFTYCEPGCENAACVEESIIPEEEPSPEGCAGDQPADECANETHLLQWECVGNEWVGNYKACDYGCENGACLEEPVETGVSIELVDVTVSREIEVLGHMSLKYKNVTIEPENRKIVLVTVDINNGKNMWLKTAAYTLEDNYGDVHNLALSIESREGVYSVEDITAFDGIENDEEIPPFGSATQKYMFEIHVDNRPVKLNVDYELKPDEKAPAEEFHTATFDLD